MNTHKDCYIVLIDCDSYEDIRESFIDWSNTNTDKEIISHCITLIGMIYLLSISYHYIDE